MATPISCCIYFAAEKLLQYLGNAPFFDLVSAKLLPKSDSLLKDLLVEDH